MNDNRKITLVSYTNMYYMLVILFRIFLDISYSTVISKEYLYIGFRNDGNIGYMILSWLALFLMMYIGKPNFENQENLLSKEIMFWLFLVSYVPFTSTVRFGLFSGTFISWNIIYWLLLMLITRPFKMKQSIRFTGIKSRVINDDHIKIITIISFLIVLYVSGRYTGFRINLNLLNVYSYRNEASGYNLPVLLDYAFSWTKTVNSVLEAYYIRKKKWGWAVACFLIQILNFGIDGSKTTLFLAIFVIVINFLPKFELKRLIDGYCLVSYLLLRLAYVFIIFLVISFRLQ